MATPAGVRRSRHNRLIRQIRATQERGGPPGDPSFYWGPFYKSLQSGGGDLKQPYSEHPWVYRAVSVISDNLISVPFKFYTGDRAEPTEVQKSPWQPLFEEPNPDQTPEMFWTLSWDYLNLTGGEAFWVLYDSNGQPTKSLSGVPAFMRVFPGATFQPLKDNAGKHVGWRQDTEGGQALTYTIEQVVHLRMPNPYDPLRGLAPLDAAARSVRTDVKAHGWNEASLDNGAEPGGVLTTEGMVTNDQVRQLRQQFNDRHRGHRNARKLAVLPNGLKYQQTGMTPKDMEFEGQRKWSKSEIAGAFGIPMMHMGDMSEIHSKESARINDRQFWSGTLVPYFRRTEPALFAQLFKPRTGDRMWGAWDLSGVPALQQDEAERMEIGKKAWDMGVSFEAVNTRLSLGYESFDGADVSFVPNSVTPLVLATETDEPEPEAEPTTDGALAGLEGTEGSQDVEVLEDLVLNGAQIQAALEIVLNVVAGDLPRDSGIGMLVTLFNLTTEQAESIMGSAGTSAETTPNPKPDNADDTPAQLKPFTEPGEMPEPPDDDAPPNPFDDDEDRAVARAATGPRRELWRAYVNNIQGPAEKQMKAGVRKWLRKRRKELLKFVESSGGRSARDLTASEIDAFMAEVGEMWDDQFRDETMPAARKATEASLVAFSESMGFAQIEMTHPAIVANLEQQGNEITRASDTVKEAVRTQLKTGALAGESTAQLSDRIRLVMNAANSRATTIARTETAQAAQRAKHTAFDEAELEEGQAKYLVWVDSGDAHVRDTHQIDGEEIPFGGEFSNGLAFPNDPSGPAEEVIHCRCDVEEIVR